MGIRFEASFLVEIKGSTHEGASSDTGPCTSD